MLCRYHIDSVIRFTENDVDGENTVYSIGITATSIDITLRDLLSKKLYETRSAIPFNEWNDEWKKNYPGKIFYSVLLLFSYSWVASDVIIFFKIQN